MAVEQIVFVGALATHLGVKVQAAGSEAARFDDLIHHQRILFHAVRELVGIPAQLRVAAVRIDRAEDTQRNRRRDLVVERVARQRGVVGLNVHFNLFFQTELLQEAIHRRHVVVILVLRRFLRFWLNQQRAAEADFVLVVDNHLHKAANLLALLTQVGVQQRFISFTATPQDIVLATQLMRGVHCRHHLRGRPAKHFRIRVGCRTCAVAWVSEAVCRAPQQLHAALLLFCRQHIHHLRKVVQILFQRRPFRRHVNIMEAVVRHVQLVEELKRHIGFAFRQLDGLTRLLPRAVKGAHAEHIGAVPAEGMPVTGGKAQMIFHALTQHQLIRVVVTKC